MSLIPHRGISTVGSCGLLGVQSSVSVMGGGLENTSVPRWGYLLLSSGDMVRTPDWSSWMSKAWAEQWWSKALEHCVSLCSVQDAGEMRPPAVVDGFVVSGS